MLRKANFLEFRLTSAVNSGDTSFVAAIAPRFKRADGTYYGLNFDNDDTVYLQDHRGTLKQSSNNGVVEQIAISSIVENGETTDGRTKYTFTFKTADDGTTKMRGLRQDDNGTDEITNVDEDLINSQFEIGDTYLIPWDISESIRLIDAFSNNTSLVTEIANGAIGLGKAYYIGSDGKAVQGTSGSSFVGIATELAADTEAFLGALPSRRVAGITVPGTIGSKVYADSNGDLTVVSTNNVYVGIKTDDNQLDVGKQAEQDLEYDNSLIVDQNTMALMNDKNIKNIWDSSTDTTTNTTDDTANVKVLGSVGKRTTATAATGVNQSMRYLLATPQDLGASDGGATLDSTAFLNVSIYISDSTKLSELKCYLVTTSGLFIDSLVKSITGFVTGWNDLRIKKSDFVTFNGSPDINSIADVVFTFKPTDTSQPYIVVDPETLQIVRQDPENAITPNPFQKETADGVFERVLTPTGHELLVKEAGGYVVAITGDGQINTAKEWDNFVIEKHISTIDDSISFDRLGADNDKGVLSFFDDSDLHLYTNGVISDAKTITPTSAAKIFLKKEGSLVQSVFTSANETVTLSASDATTGAGVLAVMISENERIKSLKITNTSAVIENKGEEFYWSEPTESSIGSGILNDGTDTYILISTYTVAALTCIVPSTIELRNSGSTGTSVAKIELNGVSIGSVSQTGPSGTSAVASLDSVQANVGDVLNYYAKSTDAGQVLLGSDAYLFNRLSKADLFMQDPVYYLKSQGSI